MANTVELKKLLECAKRFFPDDEAQNVVASLAAAGIFSINDVCSIDSLTGDVPVRILVLRR